MDNKQNIEVIGGDQNDSLQQPFSKQNDSPNETGPPAQAEPNNKQNLPTENIINQDTTDSSLMEVHHPHHPSHKKRWSEYLLEFFMLFLAVFLGFIAENVREHIVEKNRAHHLSKSLLVDLKTDTARLNRYIVGIDRKIKTIDTLYQLLQQPIAKVDFITLQKLIVPLQRNFSFVSANGTISQLKNSGYLRLFSTDFSKTVSNYDDAINLIRRNEDESFHMEELFIRAFIRNHFTPENIFLTSTKAAMASYYAFTPQNAKLRGTFNQDSMEQLSVDLIQYKRNSMFQRLSYENTLKEAIDFIRQTEAQTE